MKKGTRRGISILLMVMMLCALLVPSVLQASQSSQVEEWMLINQRYDEKMFVAPSGDIYLSVYGGLAKYDSDGVLDYEFFEDPNFDGSGPFEFIESFIINSNGEVLFGDCRHEGTRKMSPEDFSTSELIIPESMMPINGRDTNIRLDEQENFYISRAGVFSKYNPQGTLLWTVPAKEKLATSADGLSYLVDGSSTAYVVSSDGTMNTTTFLDQSGRAIKPNNVAFDAFGNIYLTETINTSAGYDPKTKVFLFSASESYLASWDLPGFTGAYDIGVDPEGRIYVFAHTMNSSAPGGYGYQNIVYRIVPKASYTVEYYVGALDGSGYLLGSSTFEDQSVGTPVTLTGGYGKGELNYMCPANEYSEGVQQGTVPKKLSIGDDNTIKVLYSKL